MDNTSNNTNQDNQINIDSQTSNQNTNPDNQIALPTTVEELQALLQKEGDKRVSSARKKFETDFNNKLEAEREEATRLAKLSKQDREREAFEKERAAFEKEKQELAHQRKVSEIVTELQAEGLPSSLTFASNLLGDTSEATLENIKAFKSEWQEAIQKEVDKRLVTKTPKMGQQVKGNSGSIFDAIKSKKVR